MICRVDHTVPDWMPNPAVPRTVALELLWGCNLKCNYCYIGVERNWQKPVVPSLSSIAAIIDKIAASGVQELYLVGGEPTAHPKFAQICDHIARSGIKTRGICTNGTLINRQTADLLKVLDFYVDVSFRGGTAELFDYITGLQGSFDRAIRGTVLLAEAGLSVGIEYDCTVQTAPYLYNLISKLAHLNVPIHQLFLHRIAPHGDAAKLHDSGQLTLSDYERVFEQAKKIENDFRIPTSFEDGFPLCLTDASNWTFITPCECGTFFATVDPSGNVRRCPCHSKILGNLLETDLCDIWSNALGTFRSMSWIPDTCRTCALLPQCRGGCSVSSGCGSEGFAPDAFSDMFIPFVAPPAEYPMKGILGQDVIKL